MNFKEKYNGIIIPNRLGKTSTTRSLSEEFSSDKNRIIFSSPFRRLQQKAQVFSLETNASVRSRLTHSLEVATIGSTIAEKIAFQLHDQDDLDEDKVLPFIKIVENACLLHDIGNPPFGHFAEEAIKSWFKKNWVETFKNSSKMDDADILQADINKKLIKDFLTFDGNPQGLRVVIKLQDIPNQFADVGLNLTLSQIASCLKYVASPISIDRNHSLQKKAGFFFTEEEKIDSIKTQLGIHGRFPLAYIMEAADDISYCISDIEDGIEKKIITPTYFFEKLLDECKCIFNKEQDILFLDKMKDKKHKSDFFTLKISVVRRLIDHCVKRYLENHEEIFNNNITELIDKESEEGKLLKCFKTLSRKYLFRSKEAENKELAGFHAIYGILDKYKSLLVLDIDKFNNLVSSKVDLNKIIGTGFDLEWRLFNRLPEKYIEAYSYDYQQLLKTEKDLEIIKQKEWIFRSHLIVDYLSSMTDNFVIETYNLLYGIKI